ncbi:MAG: fumarylacetoacetate hydrolase family protein [Planctomycetota bacterium]
MRRTFIALVFAAGLAVGYACMSAQISPSNEPFKLGTFDSNGNEFLGIVLRDTQVIDIGQANAALESSDSSLAKLAAPADMKEIIARYDTEWRERLRLIIGQVTAAQSAPSYVHALSDLKVHPPVQPSVMLMAAGNYQEHTAGIAEQQQRAAGGGAVATESAEASSAPGLWERKPGDPRRNPYLFLKSPTIVIGDGDAIVRPTGRNNLDHECEFAVVIGKVAKRAPVESAADYIFGYTNAIDVSDRGGRGDQGFGGSDWLVGKNHDTFAPLGPFITPKEFMTDPMNVRQVFTLNGDVKQDSNTSRMTHNIYELVHFASNILTLRPGDVISGGSPAGTNIERAEPQWMKPGDTAVCTIDGIGKLTHPVVAE